MRNGTKVAVVGAGAVGQACVFALLLRGSCREIVLVDKTAERAAGARAQRRDPARRSGPHQRAIRLRPSV